MPNKIIASTISWSGGFIFAKVFDLDSVLGTILALVIAFVTGALFSIFTDRFGEGRYWDGYTDGQLQAVNNFMRHGKRGGR